MSSQWNPTVTALLPRSAAAAGRVIARRDEPRVERRAGWVVLAGLLLVIRRADGFVNPQFWAEDFWPFFTEAHTVGPRVIAWPYNGYLHLLPRLIAEAATPLNPAIQPAVYLLAALALTLGVVALALSPRLELPGKPWLALAVVAVPHTGEVLLNVTNVQWVVALGLLLVLLRRDPARPGEWAEDGAVLFLGGFTGPFSVLFWPLFFARALGRRTRASWILAAGLAVPAAVQGWFLLHSPGFPDPGAWQWGRLLGVLAVRLPMTLALGERWPVALGYAWTTGLGLVVTGGLIAASSRPDGRRGARWLLLVAFAILVLAAVKRVRPDTWAFYDTFNGDRYFYTPKVIAIWLVVLVVAELRGRWSRRLAGAVVVLALAANLPAFRFTPLPDLRWANYVEKIRAGERVEVPINPGWKVVYPGRAPRKD